jgi:hypothetical protein
MADTYDYDTHQLKIQSQTTGILKYELKPPNPKYV